MAKKKDVYKVKPLNENKKNIIAALIDEYDIETADDIQEALKDLLGGTIKSMMESEMDEHLGYENYERSDNDNYRNGTKPKTVRSNYGEFQINVPQDRQSTFEPRIVKKRQKDISGIDQQIISMYARGLTTRQISNQIEEIYGFECSEGFISDVTDKILQEIDNWQNRPLDDIYPVRLCCSQTKPYFLEFSSFSISPSAISISSSSLCSSLILPMNSSIL